MEKLFKDYGKIFVRTPMYSYTSLFNAPDETKNLDDLVHLRLNDAVFLEALYWSSPQLFEAVLKFKEGGVKGAREKKLMQTLKKYIIRASTRCTPYGIYAGTGIIDIGVHQENQNSEMERKVRIDMGFLQSLKSAIESDSAVYPHLYYSLNNSLYRIPGQYRFMETIIENGACHYQLSSLEQTAFLDEILALTKGRFLGTDDIYSFAEKDISRSEFDTFITELLKTQFLVSELQIGLTVKDDLERYIEILKRLIENGVVEAKKYLNIFICIENILIHFQELTIGNLPLKEIKELQSLLTRSGIENQQEHFFHADLKQPVQKKFIFQKEKLKELENAISILGKLTTNTLTHQSPLDRFKSLFLEKYETQEVPLSQVLDPESGIGFPPLEKIGDTAYNSLLEKVGSSKKRKNNQGTETCQAWLQDKAESLDRDTLNEGIQVFEQDVIGFDNKIEQLATSFSVMGTLLPSGKVLLQSVGGSHANSLLARFAYLEDEIGKFCKQFSKTEQEANPEVIFAEVLHIPEGRTGNIARRPVLSDYEIPFLAFSEVKAERQILVDDLLVSVRQDEIVLTSRKMNKRVIPRLSNAHNYANSPVPVYKFLCSIHQLGKAEFDINWGEFASKKRFLPRVSAKNIILQRASWFLYKNDISTIIKAEDSIVKLRDFLAKWQVQRFVCFVEGDNELFIDTCNNGYLEILLEEIKTVNSAKLVEWLHEREIKDEEKDVTIQQFILPLAKKRPVRLTGGGAERITNNLKRTFMPGSEWVYFKFYCGAKLSDSVLLNVIKPAISLLLDEKIITEAFFIRYTDPHYHIRFRLHLCDNLHQYQFASVISCVYDLLNSFNSNALVWKVQLDTYQREIERYGEVSILKSEMFFFHDSLLYLNCLADEGFRTDEQVRFLLALKNVDRWLDLYNMSLEEKVTYCNEMTNVFVTEFDKSVKIQLDLKYRELRNLIPSFLNSEMFEGEFAKRDKILKGMISPGEDISSYIHMSMNRWFIAEQRLLEYMCYLFCSKHYNEKIHTNTR
jgi:lantibiotic biosynthesis protein